MSEPTITVLGIYRLNVTDELVLAQHSILYGNDGRSVSRTETESQIREQLGSVVLVEALVVNRDKRFDVSDFTQAQIGVPPDRWQAAWAEAYLSSPEGTALVEKRWAPMPEQGDLRIAFFLHYWDKATPLQTSYGEIICPEPQPMPSRLERLVPFIPVD
jgi:hypothetical protein